MGGDEARRLATWLVRERGAIEAALAQQGFALPTAASPEAEALRRFRSFVTSGLLQGDDVAPALDGLRARERKLAPLLRAWIQAATLHAGAAGPMVKGSLEPLRERFLTALRGTAPARRASGAPTRSARRAVPSAIDRVTDAFLAVDADAGTIEDANPAAGALLGTTRDELVGADAMGFVPDGERERWWTEFDAMTEGSEPRRLAVRLRHATGADLQVDVTITRWTTRRRTLALVLARPA